MEDAAAITDESAMLGSSCLRDDVEKVKVLLRGKKPSCALCCYSTAHQCFVDG
jgi:hypothetical protein